MTDPNKRANLFVDHDSDDDSDDIFGSVSSKSDVAPSHTFKPSFKSSSTSSFKSSDKSSNTSSDDGYLSSLLSDIKKRQDQKPKKELPLGFDYHLLDTSSPETTPSISDKADKTDKDGIDAEQNQPPTRPSPAQFVKSAKAPSKLLSKAAPKPIPKSGSKDLPKPKTRALSSKKSTKKVVSAKISDYFNSRKTSTHAALPEKKHHIQSSEMVSDKDIENDAIEDADLILKNVIEDFNLEQTLYLSKIEELEQDEEAERNKQKEKVSELKKLERKIKQELESRLVNNGFNGASVSSSDLTESAINTAFNPNKSQKQAAVSIAQFFDVGKETSRIMHEKIHKQGGPTDYETLEDQYLFCPIYTSYKVFSHHDRSNKKRTRKSSRKADPTLKLVKETIIENTKKKPTTHKRRGKSSKPKKKDVNADEYSDFIKLDPSIDTNTSLSRTSTNKHIWWDSKDPASLYSTQLIDDTLSRLLEQEAAQLYYGKNYKSASPQSFVPMDRDAWNTTLLSFITHPNLADKNAFQEVVKTLTTGFNAEKWSIVEAIKTVFLCAGMKLAISNEIILYVQRIYNTMEIKTSKEENKSNENNNDKENNDKTNDNNNDNHNELMSHDQKLNYKIFKNKVLGPRYRLPQINSVKLALHLSCSLLERVSKEKSSISTEPLDFLRVLVFTFAALVSTDCSLLDNIGDLDFPRIATRIFDTVPVSLWHNEIVNDNINNNSSSDSDNSDDTSNSNRIFKQTPAIYQNTFLHRAVSLACNIFSPQQFYLRLKFVEAFAPSNQVTGRLVEFHRYVSTAFVINSIYHQNDSNSSNINNYGLVSFQSMSKLFENLHNSEFIWDALESPKPSIKEIDSDSTQQQGFNPSPFVDFFFDMDNVEQLLSETILPAFRVDPVFASHQDYKFQELLLMYKNEFGEKNMNIFNRPSTEEIVKDYLGISLRNHNSANCRESSPFELEDHAGYLDQRRRVWDAFRMVKMLQYVKDDDDNGEGNDDSNDNPKPKFITTGIAEARARILILFTYTLHSFSHISSKVLKDLVSRFYDISRGIQSTIQTGIGQYIRLVEREFERRERSATPISNFQSLDSSPVSSTISADDFCTDLESNASISNYNSETDNIRTDHMNHFFATDTFSLSKEGSSNSSHNREAIEISMSDYFLPDAESLDAVVTSSISVLASSSSLSVFSKFSGWHDDNDAYAEARGFMNGNSSGGDSDDKEYGGEETVSLTAYKALAKKLEVELNARKSHQQSSYQHGKNQRRLADNDSTSHTDSEFNDAQISLAQKSGYESSSDVEMTDEERRRKGQQSNGNIAYGLKRKRNVAFSDTDQVKVFHAHRNVFQTSVYDDEESAGGNGSENKEANDNQNTD